MARIRNLKPSFWDDEQLAKSTSRDARTLYQGMWTFADEWKRVRASGDYLKGKIFPYEADLDAEAVAGLLAELVAAGKVVRYVVNGETFAYVRNLDKHNRLEPSKSASSLPPPPDVGDLALFDIDEVAPAVSTTASRAGLPGESASRGWRVEGVGGREGRRQVRADPPPSRYCPNHPNGTTRRCRPCGDAREAFEAWEAERRARQANAPPCPVHPHEFADHCRLCAGERKGKP